MIKQYLQIKFPLTHIFLICAICSIINSFLLFYKLFAIFIIFTSVTLTFSFLYLRTIFLGFICLISAICIFLRIQEKEYDYNSHTNFLNKETIIKGCIQSIQHNLQDKKTATIIINNVSIYNKETGAATLNKLILLQLPYNRSKNLKLGQVIKAFKIKLSQPPPASDYQRYLIKEGVWAAGYILFEHFYILKKTKTSWYQNCFLKLSNYFKSTTSHLYNPLFLGKKEKDSLSLNIQHQSLYWGILHHMARSGIHLVTILGLFVIIFHYLRIFHRFRFLLYAILVLFYAYISISSISFLRSLFMILFQMFARFNGLMYSSVHAFLLTTIIIIHYNPLAVLFLDFQLSFGITAVILWLFYIKWHKTIAFLSPSFINS